MKNTKNLIIIAVVSLLSACSTITHGIKDTKIQKQPIAFTVNYSNGVDELDSIKYEGKTIYNSVAITPDNFATEKTAGKDTLSGFIINFGHTLFPKDAQAWMANNGLRPGTLKELEAFGYQVTNSKNTCTEVVALGSEFICYTNHYFPYFSKCSWRSEFNVAQFNEDFYWGTAEAGHCWYLAIKVH